MTNRVRMSDLDLPTEFAPPTVAELPTDEELDAMCDQLMRLDDDTSIGVRAANTD